MKEFVTRSCLTCYDQLFGCMNSRHCDSTKALPQKSGFQNVKSSIFMIVGGSAVPGYVNLNILNA